MTSVKFDDIFARFLAIVDAYDVASFLEDDARVMMTEWLRTVRSYPKIRKLFSTITIDNEIQTVTYELKHSFDIDDIETDNDYITTLFSQGIAWVWVQKKYRSVLNTNQVFGGKEERFYSQSNHTASLENMHKCAERDLYDLIQQHVCVNNSYLTGNE